ncbi:MAG: hypothetical protein ACM3ZE_06795 [Myxococcales bacterium]
MIRAGLVAAALTLALSVLLYRTMRSVGGLRAREALRPWLFSVVAAGPSLLLTSYVLDTLEWASHGVASAAVTPLAATMLVVAPIEQLTVTVVVWPLYRARRLEHVGAAISAGVIAACGFGVVQAVETMLSAASFWMLLHVVAVFFTRVFCVGVWASFLAASRASTRRLFPLIWLGATALEGVLRYFQNLRGLAWQVTAALPLLLALLSALWYVRTNYSALRAVPVRHSRLGILVDPHGIGTVRASWQHAHRPALLHWIVGGAFVCFGANIVGLALGIVTAHTMHIDLSRVNETATGAMAPLALLGTAVLVSYPLAGYLTAKASAADSVFEPGVAALISITALAVLLSFTAPLTLVLAIALAPVAFGLACLGAWLGLSGETETSG